MTLTVSVHQDGYMGNLILASVYEEEHGKLKRSTRLKFIPIIPKHATKTHNPRNDRYIYKWQVNNMSEVK
jgi:hypothetical protein